MSSLLHRIIRLLVYVPVGAAVLACQTTQNQTTQQSLNPPEMVFSLAHLNTKPDTRNAMFQAIARGQTAVIKIDKDYIFPLIFDLKNNAAQVDLNNNTIELSFKQDMFLSISKEATKLSKDGRTWHNIKDLKALKNLLAYNKGSLTFSLSANPANSVAIVMTIATDGE
jgi:hypothetical protein